MSSFAGTVGSAPLAGSSGTIYVDCFVSTTFEVGDAVEVRTVQADDPEEARRRAEDAVRALIAFYAHDGHSARDVQRVTSCLNLLEGLEP